MPIGYDTGAGHPYPPGTGTGQQSVRPAPSRANGLRWRQVLRGEQPQLAALRRWLASMLPDCPARDDVISVATELASNALAHTASGRGGWFAVEITRYQSVVRVAVADQGGSAEPHVIDDPAAEHGRGLLLVRGLSLRTGVTGDQRGRLVWADVAFEEPDAVAGAPDPYEPAIREGQAALTRRFGDVPSWFGRSTLAWWALAGPGELVTASSAPELASLLYGCAAPEPHARPRRLTRLVSLALPSVPSRTCRAAGRLRLRSAATAPAPGTSAAGTGVARAAHGPTPAGCRCGLVPAWQSPR